MDKLGQIIFLLFLGIGMGMAILFPAPVAPQSGERAAGPERGLSPTPPVTVRPILIAAETLPTPEPTPTWPVITPTPEKTAGKQPRIEPPAEIAYSRNEVLFTPTPSPTLPATPPPSTPPATATPLPPTAVGRFLQVDQDQQVMHVYENGVKIRAIPVSTGAPTTTTLTPPWQGQVGSDWGSGPIGSDGFYVDYMWYLFPGLEGSILIHSLPYIPHGQEKIYDQPEALGLRPTSASCIRISPEAAAWLKTWDPVGAAIEISRWSGRIERVDPSSQSGPANAIAN